MNCLTDRIRVRIEADGRPIRSIAADSGVSYWQVYNWYKNRSPRLEADVADALWRTMTGRALR